ncbi:non-ribosomal peptide synthetase [Nonomuraea sp. NPDC050643]|uniref:non-ribosomal peptide synthetase n=1 Tax=Nonomuraea sp. NPDC050643 TaxID=3155660 RepID=UPI0033E3D917
MDLLPHLIETVASEQPEAVAIDGPRGALSYGELLGRTRTFAGLLRELGAAPGEVVAVEGAGTPAAVTALTGALYAGCVILPIDPALSPELRDTMIDAARARFLVRADDGEWRVSDPGRRVPLPDRPSPLAAPAGLDPRAPAYVCFTSGSTGRPKAVLGAHDSLAHFLRWQRDTFEVGHGDRMAQLTSWSFDVVLRDLFTPLVSGATLCLPGSRSRDAERVFAFARTYAITLLHVVPSLARRWLAADAAQTGVPTLRVAFFAGEPLHTDLVGDWRRRVAPGSRVVNLYGPTETTLAQCFYEVPPEPEAGPLPVGRTLPGCSASVVRPGSWHPTSPGEPGEVVLTTPYRSLGYLGTGASTFATTPAGEPAYRTGDVGRWDERGLLHLLGRLDQQVKVRGVRLRPPEVERVLRGVPGVREAAVVDAADEHGSVRLVGFLVAGPALPPVRDLREAIVRELPAAAVPDEFVLLTDLPLLPNGKVDRTDLREQAGTRAPAKPVDAPPGDGNALVVETCRRVLGVEAVPVTADLFELGVDSMSAMEIAARLEDLLGGEIPLGLVFDHPTVEDISRYLVHRGLA